MTVAHRCLFVVAIAIVWSPVLQAQTASGEDRLRNALRDTTRQLHEAQDEVAALHAELTSVKQQMAQQTAAAPKSCAPTADISPRARRQIENLAAENEALRKNADEAQKVVARWQEAQTQWQAGLKQATQQAQINESAAKGSQEQLQQSAERERGCTTKNAQLVEIGNELLGRYRDKGIWESLRNAEPMTQIHRVQFETLVQEYSGKIQDNRYSPQINPPVQTVEHGKQN